MNPKEDLAEILAPYEMELGPNDGFPAVIAALDAHEFADAILEALEKKGWKLERKVKYHYYELD